MSDKGKAINLGICFTFKATRMKASSIRICRNIFKPHSDLPGFVSTGSQTTLDRERFQKYAVSVSIFTGFVWTGAHAGVDERPRIRVII